MDYIFKPMSYVLVIVLGYLLKRAGFFGRDDSKMKRKELLIKLNLPERMSSNALVEMINAFMSADEYKKAAEEIKKNYDK